MPRRDTIILRACEECGFIAQIVKNWKGSAPNGTIECPNCKKFTFNLRSREWIEYACWKGTIGPGRQLQNIIKEAG